MLKFIPYLESNRSAISGVVSEYSEYSDIETYDFSTKKLYSLYMNSKTINYYIIYSYTDIANNICVIQLNYLK